MSRSYKKHPWVTDGGTPGTKYSKRFANKKVRRNEDIPNGGSYKKVYESWEIRDYKWYWTWEEAKKDWEENKNYYLKHHFPNLKSYYRYWVTHNKTK